MKTFLKDIQAANFILEKTSFNGDTAIILGSGLGKFSEILTERKKLSYRQIPNYPVSNVEGHKCELIVGKLSGKEILVASGRVHCYEGYSKEEVTFPIRTFSECGLKNLIITKSSGSLNKNGLFIFANTDKKISDIINIIAPNSTINLII